MQSTRDPSLGTYLGTDANRFERRSGYEAAKTTDENSKHWRDADGLGPVSQVTPEVRRTLRNRCRHEVQNGCYASGIVRTLVGDTIGTGPRLQMLDEDASLNAEVEALWRIWEAASFWSLKARLLAGVNWINGEGYGLYRDSKRLARLGIPVTLDVRLIEPDQVAHPYGGYFANPETVGDDGIDVDDEGEPVSYRVLKSHPGDFRIGMPLNEADTVAAENVIHWFVPTRPGQLRGVTQMAPALPILNQLRRFTSATLTSAEVAALLSGVMKTTLGPDEAPIRGTRYYDTVDLVRGTLLGLPAGWDVQQFRPEQPIAGYAEFVDKKLEEIGRAINMPFGKVAGNHSRYNYSSARMDDGNYWSDRTVERNAFEAIVQRPLFYRWCDFARFVIPALSKYRGAWWKLKHCWHYDGRQSIDPVKDATGDELNLTNGSDTLAAIAARDGTTVEALLDQRQREMAMFRDRGLPLPPWLSGAPAPARVVNDQPMQGAPANAA